MENELKEKDTDSTENDILDDVDIEYIGMDDVTISSQIEIPEKFIPCKDKDSIDYGLYYHTTGDVAVQLGVHRNIVLNYTNTFYDFLEVTKNPMNGRYKYTKNAIKQLAYLINDRLNNHRTLKQELDYIQSTSGAKTMDLAVRGPEAVEKLFNNMQDAIIENMKQLMDNNNQAVMKYLQTSEQLRLEDLESEKKTYKILEERITEQEAIMKEILYDKNKEIALLKNKIQEQEEQLKKKKRLFSFGRKD